MSDTNTEKTATEANVLPCYYVGIGASAGGLEAIEAFFEQMPPDSGLAFIVIQHLSPDFKSLMTELLSKRTQMPVYKIEDGMSVEANSIYMIPPRKNLTLFHGKLLFKEQDRSQGSINLPIDVFFQSLAEDQGEKAIGVVLSGTGSDGTRGIRRIKELGGMVMVQSQESAKFDGMPRSAINTGLVDFILPPEQMPGQLLSFAQHPYAQKSNLKDTFISDDNSLTRLFSLLRERHKIDFTYYKPSTILRRVERRMITNQIYELKDYVIFMESYHKEIDALYRELLIGVTNFFRDPEAFAVVKQLLPEIFQRVTDREIRLWTAGCSTGEEAYTLAILCQETMEELGKKYDVKIFATDIDKNSLAIAGNGIYPDSIAGDLNPTLLSKYFQHQNDCYHVNRKLREMVVFAQHNLIKDPPFTSIDLLSCRNLLIYLQTVLQKKALEFFNFALVPQGVLMLGTSESLGELSEFFDPIDQKWKLFLSKGKRKLGGFALEVPNNYKLLNQHSYTSSSNRPVNEDDRFLERYLQLFADNSEQLLAVVVNDKGELIYTLCDKEKYLAAPLGRSSYDLNKMIIKELAVPLATGLQKVFKSSQEVRYSSITLKTGEHYQNVQMRIKPLPEKKGQNTYAAVFVEKSTDVGLLYPSQSVSERYDVSKETQQRLQDLEQELQFTKENLQATIEELETSNEELQATNEELLASNEELQSTNEELQSVNEELFTVNSEHQQKIIELTVLNNDVENLLQSIEIATLFIDENLEVRRFTPKINQIFKIIDSDLGRPLTHLAHYLSNLDPVHLVQSVMSSQKSIEQEIKTSDGRQYLMNALPYKIAPHIYSGVVMTFIDITAIKEAQTTLELTQERFNLAQQLAKFGVWDWDIKSDKLYWSDNIEVLFDLKKGSFNHSYLDFLTHVHSKDRELVNDATLNALNFQEPFYIEHRGLCPDKTNIRWFSETGKVFYDNHNKPVRMLGVLQDITDRRRVIEEKNQAQHDLLLADFVFQSLRPTSITDADGTILQVNNAFVKLTGYEREEIIGKNHRILNSERQDKNFYQKMWQTLLENDYWEGDLWNRHKNGGFYLENLRVMAIKNSQSQERYYIGFFQKLKESTDTPK